jgi:hypothetical protein
MKLNQLTKTDFIQFLNCPEFSYSELDIQDGTSALDTWGRLVEDKNFSEDKEETKKNLLSYCELDTLAMVKIYEYLKSLN